MLVWQSLYPLSFPLALCGDSFFFFLLSTSSSAPSVWYMHKSVLEFVCLYLHFTKQDIRSGNQTFFILLSLVPLDKVSD